MNAISYFKAIVFTLLVVLSIGAGQWYGKQIDKRFFEEQTRATEAARAVEEALLEKLIVVDTVAGTGPEAVIGDTLTVHYTGTFENGDVFDSSREGGQPLVFTLGAGKVIRGWDLGLKGLRVGGVRKLTIPPELAYGEQGSSFNGKEVIPPNATLHFEIELLGTKGGE